MTYQVIYSPEAEDDLERLFVHVLERELNSPFSCRKTGESAFMRELIISFGSSGYVAIFDIRDSDQVIIGAMRHQHESDYH